MDENRQTGEGEGKGLWSQGHFFFFFFSFVLVFQDRVSLCNSPGCTGTRSVDQAGLRLTEIHLPLPLRCWDKGLRHHCPAAHHFLALSPCQACFFCYLRDRCGKENRRTHARHPKEWLVPEFTIKHDNKHYYAFFSHFKHHMEQQRLVHSYWS